LACATPAGLGCTVAAGDGVVVTPPPVAVVQAVMTIPSRRLGVACFMIDRIISIIMNLRHKGKTTRRPPVRASGAHVNAKVPRDQ
jgi:hypothetical protein